MTDPATFSSDILRTREEGVPASRVAIASLDFETANYSRVSICSAGIAIFADGQLVESPSWLIRPPKGHGWFREDFTDIGHSIELGWLEGPREMATDP